MLATDAIILLPLLLSSLSSYLPIASAEDIGHNPEVPNQIPPESDELLPDSCSTAPLPLPADIQAAYPGIDITSADITALIAPGPENVLPRPPSAGEFEAELIATSNSTQHATDQELQTLHINCKGSFWCPWFNVGTHRYILYLLQWMRAIPAFRTYRYYKKVNIACARLWDDDRAYCVFPQGNVPDEGVTGDQVMGLMEGLLRYGCFACGSVPIALSGDPAEQGIVTVNYVKQANCPARKGMVICDPSERPGPPPGQKPGTAAGNVQVS